ncbi:SDR family oxidoreductase [Aliiroseovarius lamellibrachiae]|uniref:SDR family oxidoreductase n=1 Tax=Aliiroseovarius lamellibrachiae TaxID=1924933 RepID=UPI001BDFFCD0|nr:SDR family oxidoreductase [Aliiroseovarius lamellibrachiae]MBT2130276.1 SDR family oxidoreductase [Aliiroseovarius lamellibrachiae]
MTHVIVAGATGYLGQHLVTALRANGDQVSVIMRPSSKVTFPADVRVIYAEATQPDSLRGVFQGADVVISALGLTKQSDKLSYDDVDYRANLNLLEAATAAGVAKFAYVHVLTRGGMASELVAAKTRFVTALQSAPIASLVIRPGGYFSDLAEVFNMAKSGRIWLVGDGSVRLNPIHGADLAEAIVQALKDGETDIEIGGPEVLSMDDIARLAFEALGKPPNISHLPAGLLRAVLKVLKPLTARRIWGPLEFFLAASAQDMIAPAHGDNPNRRLGRFFRGLAA